MTLLKWVDFRAPPLRIALTKWNDSMLQMNVRSKNLLLLSTRYTAMLFRYPMLICENDRHRSIRDVPISNLHHRLHHQNHHLHHDDLLFPATNGLQATYTLRDVVQNDRLCCHDTRVRFAYCP